MKLFFKRKSENMPVHNVNINLTKNRVEIMMRKIFWNVIFSNLLFLRGLYLNFFSLFSEINN